MNEFEAMVMMPTTNGSFIPTRMTGSFRNYLEAVGYFSKFGKITMGPRIIN